MEEEYDPLAAMLIMLGRQYDLLMVIARSVDPDSAAKIEEIHENGGLLAADPSYLEFNNE